MEKTARLFKALSDETRLRILALLNQGELCVCDLMAILELPQSTVSRHLAYLRNSDLVLDRRQGLWMYYRLPTAPSPMARDLLRLLPSHLGELEQPQRDRAALERRRASAKDESCRKIGASKGHWTTDQQ